MKRYRTLFFSLTCLMVACDSGANRTGTESVELPHVTRKGDVELHQTGSGKVRMATDEEDDNAQQDAEPLPE